MDEALPTTNKEGRPNDLIPEPEGKFTGLEERRKDWREE